MPPRTRWEAKLWPLSRLKTEDQGCLPSGAGEAMVLQLLLLMLQGRERQWGWGGDGGAEGQQGSVQGGRLQGQLCAGRASGEQGLEPQSWGCWWKGSWGSDRGGVQSGSQAEDLGESGTRSPPFPAQVPEAMRLADPWACLPTHPLEPRQASVSPAVWVITFAGVWGQGVYACGFRSCICWGGVYA